MEIKYLKALYNNPMNKTPDSDYIKKLEPISLNDIANLENTYNMGNQFPVSLRELLYLAGNDCYVLDYGRNDSPAEVQEFARRRLLVWGRSITRPFFVVDVYNALSQFLFVYLDENQNDPAVYSAVSPDTDSQDEVWITMLSFTLSQVINKRMSLFLSGYNPF